MLLLLADGVGEDETPTSIGMGKGRDINKRKGKRGTYKTKGAARSIGVGKGKDIDKRKGEREGHTRGSERRGRWEQSQFGDADGREREVDDGLKTEEGTGRERRSGKRKAAHQGSKAEIRRGRERFSTYQFVVGDGRWVGKKRSVVENGDGGEDSAIAILIRNA